MELYSPLYASAHEFEDQLAALIRLQAAIGTMHDVEVCLAAQPQLAACEALVVGLRGIHDAAWANFAQGRDALLAPEGRQALVDALGAQ
jgi:hypothetical protein